MEEALHGLETPIEDVIAALPVVVLAYDVAGSRFSYVSPQVSAILGYSPMQLLQQDASSLQSLIHSDDLAVLDELIAQLTSRQDQEGVVNELRLRRANGEWRWIRARAVVASRTDARQPRLVLVTAEDVTDSKLQELSVQKREAYHRQMFERNQAVKFLIDPETGEIVDANPAASRFYGYTLEQLRSMRIQNINMLPEERVAEAMTQARAGSPQPLLFQHRLASGERRDVEVYSTAIEINQRTLLYSIVHDITERRQAEDALRKSEAILRAIFDQSFQFTGLLSPDGTLLETNQSSLDFVGLQAEDVVGRPFWEAHWWSLSAETQERLKAAVAEAARGRFVRYDVQVRGAGNTLATIDFSLRPVTDEKGNVVLIIPEGRDITEHKRVADALERHGQRWQILHDIEQAILSARSPGDIAQAAMPRLRQLVPCERAGTVVFDFQTGIAERLALDVEGETRLLRGQRMPLSFWGIGGPQWAGEMGYLPDLQAAAARPPFLEELIGEGMRSHLSVPLVAHATLVGSLNLSARREAAFSPEDTAFARQVANSLAVAIQNARLYEAATLAQQTADTLRAANLALTKSLDPDVVLSTLLEYLARLIPYDQANVMLLEDDDTLSVRASRGYSKWTDLAGVTFSARANALIRQLLITQQPVLVRDTGEHPAWEIRPGAERTQSWLALPLIAGGKPIGIFSMDKAEPGFFTVEHARLGEALAAQAAVALDSARLFKQVRESRHNLQIVSRRLVEVQESERRRIARELYDEAGQTLASLIVGLSLMERETGEPGTTSEQTRTLKVMAASILEKLHDLATDLRPVSLDHLGLAPALRQHTELFGQQHDINVQFETVDVGTERLASEVETTVYRIVQEALTNISRQAQVTGVGVILERRGDRLLTIIEDDGGGLEAGDAASPDRLSILAMQERAQAVGGNLLVEHMPGHGTTMYLDVPYQPLGEYHP